MITAVLHCNSLSWKLNLIDLLEIYVRDILFFGQTGNYGILNTISFALAFMGFVHCFHTVRRTRWK
jgi:hypothetical protein